MCREISSSSESLSVSIELHKYMTSNNVSQWRQLRSHEKFEYDHLPNAGARRGYAVTISMMLPGHENCGCMRSYSENKVMFLAHSDDVFGDYPMHYLVCRKIWHRKLCQQVHDLKLGEILHISEMSYGASSDISYGALL